MRVVRVTLLLLLLPVFGCGDDKLQVKLPAAVDSDAVPGQPNYSATGTVANGAISISVTATNPESHTIRFVLRQPCTVILRVFASAERATAPVWDQAAKAGGCKSFQYPVELKAGQSETWTANVSVTEVMAGQNFIAPVPLAPGAYYFEALVAQFEPQSATVRLAAGNADLRP